MKLTIVLFAFFIGSSTFAQQSAEEKELQQVIETFFEGFHKQDSVLIKSVVSDKVSMKSVMKNREGKEFLHEEDFSNFLKSIVSIPSEVTFEEKIHSYSINSDGTMANVWTPYYFYMNGSFSHCGVNNFQLYKEGGAWNIIHLMDTRRREGCENN